MSPTRPSHSQTPPQRFLERLAEIPVKPAARDYSLRLAECLSLRVKDLDSGHGTTT